ncbi:hypothetical protein F2P56_015218 [Juglans regia]|uniref:Uncharacterized protein LOC108987307 n=2 Tax=Juglans regia TaxID=51240 RepID=A0A2I4E8M3_JUGRE|nr:uncharacterized protein LOC108987307 [Juglans regia]KAF5465189.1 hypothetical protein F2P56_015218 [Juglans regia]
MLPQQQNPPETSHSLQQKNCLDDKSLERDIQSFSIRQYALASRQNDIYCSWPFPEKYLQICFKHGIHNVLPPFEPRGSAILSLRQGASFKSSGKDNEKDNSFDDKVQDFVGQEKHFKYECDSYSYEEISKLSSQDCHLSLSSSCKLEESNHITSDLASSVIVSKVQPSITMPSLHLDVDQNSQSQTFTKMLMHKLKRRKGKRKKRSMVDILAVANNCTLQDLYRINRILGCGSEKPLEHGSEGNDAENNCESELTNECLDKRLQRDDCEPVTVNALSKKQLVLKFKFSGHKPN